MSRIWPFIITTCALTFGVSLVLYGFIQEYGHSLINIYQKHNVFFVIGIAILLFTAVFNTYGKRVLSYVKCIFLRPYLTWIDIVSVATLPEVFYFFDEKYWLPITLLYFSTYLLLSVSFYFWEKFHKKNISDTGRNPFNPLSEQDQDTLQRKDLVNHFHSVITSSNNKIRVFAVTGKPGVGKTSLVLMFKNKIKQTDNNKYHVIYFDAHFYKDSYKLLQAYVQSIIREIEKHEYLSGELKLIFDKIINFAISQTNNKLATVMGGYSDANLDKLISDLTTIVSLCSRQIILIVDDIDRLDKDELSAVLNVTRLLKSVNSPKVPKLIQVLCYNRSYLDQQLYGNSLDDRTKSQECLSKIVEKELRVPVLVEPFSRKGLYVELKKLLSEVVLDDDKNEFKDKVEKNLTDLCKIMLTMRQARKIIYHTVDLYRRDKNAYNLWDLYIVTVILYCFPDVFDLMEKYPTWFQHWSGQVGEIQDIIIKNISKGDRAEKDAQYYNHFSRLRDVSIIKLYPSGIEQQLIGVLLRLLEISTILGSDSSSVGEDGALKVQYSSCISYTANAQLDEDSRLCHPNHYLRYFYHAYLDNEITRSEINELKLIVDTDSFSSEFKNKLLLASNEGRLYPFLDRWSLYTKNKLEKWDIRILKKLALALAENSNLFVKPPIVSIYDHESHIAFSYITRIIRLIAKLTKNLDDATELTIEIVKNSTYLYFSGLIVFHANNPDRGSIPIETVDTDKVNIAFADRIKRDFQKVSFFDGAQGHDLIAIICWLNDNSIKEEYLLRDLQNDPKGIFSVIEINLQPGGKIVPELKLYLPFIENVYNSIVSKIDFSSLSDQHKLYWQMLEELLEKEPKK